MDIIENVKKILLILLIKIILKKNNINKNEKIIYNSITLNFIKNNQIKK